jgi:hypothetical protein
MEALGMIVDFSWSGGFVLCINHTDQAIIEVDEDEYEMANAILIHLGFVSVAIIFID